MASHCDAWAKGNCDTSHPLPLRSSVDVTLPLSSGPGLHDSIERDQGTVQKSAHTHLFPIVGFPHPGSEQLGISHVFLI